MQTTIPEHILQTNEGYRADLILRNCVHCGFCTATCPTYQLTGDELDGPRGRIYLIKQVMEGTTPTIKTLSHLDRCLTCRSCETTCPSGVEYSRLLDIGRGMIEKQIKRPLSSSMQRDAIHWLLENSKRFELFYKFGQFVSFALPKRWRVKKSAQHLPELEHRTHSRKMLLLQGCVQPTMQPDINTASVMILDRLGISVTTLTETECCGAISHHMNKHTAAIEKMRNNINRWLPYIEQGYEAIVSNATGCGITLKDYASYFEDDPEYADKAQIISDHVKDISELVATDYKSLTLAKPIKVAFHAPCTMQHGLKIADQLGTLLQQLGFKLVPFEEGHMCCGSSGTYSLLQPVLSQQLKIRKLEHLQKNKPDFILTANIGCQHHLASESRVPVLHWIELLARELQHSNS